MLDRRPYAYLRVSRVVRDQEIISPEMQLAAAEGYAAHFGDRDLIVLTDLNISGRKGRKDRPAFDRLLSAIEADEVSAVYSYSLSRLSRSVRDIMALAELCKAHDVAIRLARDTDPDPTTATGRAVLALLGVMAQLEADLASERALDAVQARRARGDVMGTPVFADHASVITAFREAGSCTGAAKLLTARGILTRNRNRLWHPSAVDVILRRTAPELLPAVRARGVKAAAPFLFYRLLRCHCETTLTGWRRHSGYVAYRCTRGRLDPRHGTTTVPESRVLAWAMTEARRLRPPEDPVALGEQVDEGRAALQARLDLLRSAVLANVIDEAEMLATKVEIDAALTRLDLQGRVVRVPSVQWVHPPADVNRILRLLWNSIQLDAQMQPVAAEWLVPASWLATQPAEPDPGSAVAPRVRRRRADARGPSSPHRQP